MLSSPSAAITRLRRGIVMALEVFVLALLASALFIRMPQVSGLSMEPRIGSGEYVLIDTIAYRLGPVRRGDIVAFKHGSTSPESYLKRVVGLPAERIAIAHGIVTIDGKPLAEGYVRYRDDRTIPEQIVPRDAYFVLGDNRANSDDSRDWGFVPASAILGKVRFALWPPARLGRL